jgi:sulfonate transport system substrate-binding protein
VSAYSQQAKLTSGGVDVNSLLAPQFVNNALKELKLERYWDASATTNVANR